MSIGERLIELRDGTSVKNTTSTNESDNIQRQQPYGKTDSERISSLERKIDFLYFWIFILPFIIYGLFLAIR